MHLPSSIFQEPGRAAIACLALAMAGAGSAVQGAPLSTSAGSVTLQGTLDNGGTYEIRAVLQAGNFAGAIKITAGGQTMEAPLKAGQSYLENGKCYFRFEQGRTRGELGGVCTAGAFEGHFETFAPGQGLATGKHAGTLALRAGTTPTAAAGTLPTAKLTCAYQDRKYSARAGEPTQYSLQFSNLGSLTLRGDRYQAGSSAGSFQREGASKIRLTSGPWSGALGTLEPDRSGRPAVIFHIEENRRPDGVHHVDPYTTRCTEARP